MVQILDVINKALEGLNLVNPRQSNAGGMRSGDYENLSLHFSSPGGTSLTLRIVNNLTYIVAAS